MKSKHCVCKRFSKQHVGSKTLCAAASQTIPACLQESIPDGVPPPRPQLLAALRKRLTTYQEKRNSLLSEEDDEAATSVQADAGQAASCADKHEMCPFWASTVRHKLGVYHVGLNYACVEHHKHHCKYFTNMSPMHACLLGVNSITAKAGRAQAQCMHAGYTESNAVWAVQRNVQNQAPAACHAASYASCLLGPYKSKQSQYPIQ